MLEMFEWKKTELVFVNREQTCSIWVTTRQSENADSKELNLICFMILTSFKFYFLLGLVISDMYCSYVICIFKFDLSDFIRILTHTFSSTIMTAEGQFVQDNRISATKSNIKPLFFNRISEYAHLSFSTLKISTFLTK